MITLTRSQVRRLRSVFRRSTLGIHHKGAIPPLVLRADGGQLRAHYRYRDLAIEYVEPGTYRPAAAVAIPLDALADFEGPGDTPVVLEPVDPGRTAGRWQDRGIPQAREYDVTPVESTGEMPELPPSWAAGPPELLAALAEATETTTDDSRRYALDCIHIRGSRDQIIATDGRQLLIRSGFGLSWAGDVLIKGSPLFACRALPRDRPVDVGRTDTHVVFRVGPWTIACEVQKDARFPEVERVIPQPAEVATRLRLDAEDAGFLESALGRLPGAGDINAPVTIDLNGEVAVRADAADHPDRFTEIILNRSSYTGSPLRICTNRTLLGRALHLGYTEIGFAQVDSPFVCRDGSRTYAVQPLSGGVVPGAEAHVTRIESGAAGGGEGRSPAPTAGTRRTTTVRESRDGHEPPPSGGRNNTPARPVELSNAAGSEPPGTSLAALIQEAEALHASLADARSRTARLIAGLRRQRKQSRQLQETLKALRQLRLVEAAG
jgi:hypothetical protein